MRPDPGSALSERRRREKNGLCGFNLERASNDANVEQQQITEEGEGEEEEVGGCTMDGYLYQTHAKWRKGRWE